VVQTSATAIATRGGTLDQIARVTVGCLVAKSINCGSTEASISLPLNV